MKFIYAQSARSSESATFKNRRLRAVLALGIVVVLPFILSSCGNASGSGSAPAADKTKPSDSGAPKKPVRLYPVRVAAITTRPLQYELKTVGSVEAQDIYTIEARLPGTVQDASFNAGDSVARQTVLCRIAPEAYHQNALKADAQYRQAAAQLADTRRRITNNIERQKIRLQEASIEIARRRSIKEVGAISEEEVQLFQSKRDLAAVELEDATQAAQTEVVMLEALIAEREALSKIAQEDVRKSIVLAPIDGVIEKRLVINGEYVTAGTPIAVMVDFSSLKLRFKLSEKDAAAVQPGTKVIFNVPAFPGQDFESSVYYISRQVEPETRVLECLAKITTGAEHLKHGYFASIRAQTDAKKNAVVVPSTAILPTEKGFVAFVLHPGPNGSEITEKRVVRTGPSVTGEAIEILDGLAEGERLVVEGASALQDGVAVRIIGE